MCVCSRQCWLCRVWGIPRPISRLRSTMELKVAAIYCICCRKRFAAGVGLVGNGQRNLRFVKLLLLVHRYMQLYTLASHCCWLTCNQIRFFCTIRSCFLRVLRFTFKQIHTRLEYRATGALINLCNSLKDSIGCHYIGSTIARIKLNSVA